MNKAYPNFQYTVTGGYTINLAETGSGPAVVFIHGSGPGASGASNFRLNAAAFEAAGYRVILPDLIGYGASSKPEGIDYTLDLFTNTLMNALRQHGITQASFVGNSLGGGIALQIALNQPDFVKNLVLMAPGCIEDIKTYMAMPGISKMMSNFGTPAFTIEEQRRLITNLVYDAHFVTDELVAERYAVARTQPKDMLVRMRTPNLQPRLGEITKPILGFWGIHDEFCPKSGAQYFLDQCPDVRFMFFSKVAHWVQVERAKEFNQYSIGFLNEHR